MHARVLQFLSSYWPKTDKSIKLILDIFKVPMTDTQTSLDHSQLPQANLAQALKSKATAEPLRDSLALKYKTRLTILQVVKPVLESSSSPDE
jgi:hypothetical protein